MVTLILSNRPRVNPIYMLCTRSTLLRDFVFYLTSPYIYIYIHTLPYIYIHIYIYLTHTHTPYIYYTRSALLRVPANPEPCRESAPPYQYHDQDRNPEP